ncbi:MAG: DUF3800 domain-containing protein [Rhodobacteraceae bacterium]|nr:DUF3800 domain-containing protein [Paracoccaceae bacterium]
MLQAFIDDSMQHDGDRRLYFAGYINTVENWLAFNEEWDAALSEGKSIEYFKMRDCHARRGEFIGWGKLDREIKRLRLAKVIRKFDPWSIHVSVSTRTMKKLYTDKIPHGFKDPYMMLFIAMTVQIANVQNARGDDGPVDLIFDEQSQIERSVGALYRGFKDMQPDYLRRRMGGTPLFRNDMKVKPIQAADMLAWYIRRETRDGKLRPKSPEMDYLIADSKHYFIHVDDHALERMRGEMAGLDGAKALTDKKTWKEVISLVEQMNATRNLGA